MRCRHCAAHLTLSWADLGSAPASNAYLSHDALRSPERWYPLRVLVCEQCWLVQTEDFAQAHELFDADYAYFSSFSTSWLAHAERYVAMVAERFDLNERSHVVEIAANDGYLLQFVQARLIPCTGIEPTASTAAAARQKGLTIVEEFFGVRLAEQMAAQSQQADLVVANNVLAHVPDINDFVRGIALLLKPLGVATFEFPHLMRLIDENQFDTIYHEHFSYLSFSAVCHIFLANGLTVFDVEEHPTHGGSLRVYAQCSEHGQHLRTAAVDTLLAHEAERGLTTAAYYAGFQASINKVKNDFLGFLLNARRQDQLVVGYGAAAKGNTLLNYAGIRPDLLAFVADRNPAKQQKHMPGSRIPIVNEAQLKAARPDYVVVLPWNLKAEVMLQLEYIRGWGGQFVTAVPWLEVS
ncbi:MAG: class I SAM-dependent methyltransferase [Bradymonadaceae bacterium]|nr:class I SAM-dependent methyltransferase [Lujinxingiaceae bacterium]